MFGGGRLAFGDCQAERFFHTFRVGSAENGSSLGKVIEFGDQPAWAFGNFHDQYCVQDSRDRFHAKHPSPIIWDTCGTDPIVGYIGHHDAKHNVELVKCHEEASAFGRGDLRNVHGCHYRGGAYSQSTQESEEGEGSYIPSNTGAYGRDKIEEADPEQTLFSPHLFGRDAAQQGTNYGSVECRSDG